MNNTLPHKFENKPLRSLPLRRIKWHVVLLVAMIIALFIGALASIK
jgi:hypothetical protein